MQQLQWQLRESMTTLEDKNRELRRVKELYDMEVESRERERLMYNKATQPTAPTPPL